MHAGAGLTILQVTPALDTGGVERTTVEIAQAVTAAGGRALVASRGGRLEPELAAAGGELKRLPAHSKNPVTMLANVGRLSRLAAREGVALIHARSRAPAWSAWAAARQRRLPFVTTYHGIYSARSGLKRFYNSVMARGDVVIANSNYTRAHILAEHKVDAARVVAIPRGADLDVFDAARVAPARAAALRAAWGLGPEEQRTVILAPARVSRWKGQALLIEAARLVEAESPGEALYILAGDAQGRDGYVEGLFSAIEAAGLKRIVRLVGHVADMPGAFAAADFAVFPPTEPEAFGRGAVEAQAMGLAVIAADHGGLSETIVDGRTGRLFPPRDAKALAAAILDLLRMPREARTRLGAAGRERARALYSVAALQQATLDVYRRLLHNGAP